MRDSWYGRSLAAPALVVMLYMWGCAGAKEAEPPEPTASTQPDTVEFVAHGTEPFWSVDVRRAGIVFSEPGHTGVAGPYEQPARRGAALVFRTVLHDTAATPLELTLEAGPCNDSMSDREYAYAAVVRVGGRVLRGCGEAHLAAGTSVDRQAALDLGEWAVVGHRMPGVGAMSEAEAAAWHGRIAHYASALAAFGTDSCLMPSYRSREVRGDSLLGVDYHVVPSALGLAPGVPLTLIEVRCGESPWAAPGGRLLRMPDGTTYTVWDGTFFELRHR